MTGLAFEHARKRGTVGRIGQLNPLGRYGVAEGESLQHLVLFLLTLFWTEIAQVALFLASGKYDFECIKSLNLS